MDDAITKEITVNAPIQTVWEVVTKPDKWLAEKAAVELQPGKKGTVSWSSMGDAPVEVITVERPHTFAFTWIAPDKETHGTEATLITFNLSEVDGGTLVRVAESGFSKIALTDAEKSTLIENHTPGWEYFLTKIRDEAEGAVAQA